MSEWRESTPSATDAGEVTEIEQEITRTQGAMSGTLDAIQEKLNPGALMEQARGPVEDTSDHIVAEVQRAVRESADHLVERATEVLRDAPGPLLAQVRGPVEEVADHLIARVTAAAEEATDHILEQARATATEAASDIVARTGEAVRAATIGKVEHMVQTVGNTTRDMAEGANDTTKGFGSAVMGTIERNPLPAALAAIGLGWLYLKRPQGASRRVTPTPYTPYTPYRADQAGRRTAGDTVGSAAGAVGDTVGSAAGAVGDAASTTAGAMGDAASTTAGAMGDAVGNVGDALGSAAGTVGSTVGSAASAVGETVGGAAAGTQDAARGLVAEVQHQASQVGNGFQKLAQENPLAVGVAGVALGSLIGLLVPETQGERQLLGGARDTLMDKATGTAQETMDKVGTIATEAGDTAKQEAQKKGLLS